MPSATKAKPTETAETLKARIRAHHTGDPRISAPEWAVMTEVANETGAASRYADAVAMNLWPSRGLAIHGFEVKVYRSDWTRELKDPEKAEAIQRYCDYWWIVAPEGVVQDGELPDGWGLYVPNNGARLRMVTKAAKSEHTAPVGRSFLAAMLRRAVQQSPDKLAIEAAVAAERRRAEDAHRESLKHERDRRLAVERVIEIINGGPRGKGRISQYSTDEELAEIGRLIALTSDPARLARHVEATSRLVIQGASALIAEAQALIAAASEPVSAQAPATTTTEGAPIA